MRPSQLRRRGTPLRALVGLVLAALAAAGCARGADQPTATPAATAEPTAVAVPSQPIAIDDPPAGTTVNSPFTLRGRTARFPTRGQLLYRVFDANQRPIGTGTFRVAGVAGQPAGFKTAIQYATPTSGRGRVDVLEIAANGATRAIGSRRFNLLASAPPVVPTAQPGRPTVIPPAPTAVMPPTPTAVPAPTPTAGPAPTATTQAITILTPAPGAQVGSPVVITGQTTRAPGANRLNYRVVDANGNQLGAGTFPVVSAPAQPPSFNASISFNLPANGGPIRVELTDQKDAKSPVLASASINLTVAAPQQTITITSPAPGTLVGSPVVVAGRTSMYPSQGVLSYRVVDASGNQLGGGSFKVSGAVGQPSSFTVSISFSPPPSGSLIRLELFDQNAASTSIDLAVTPAQQAITIASPAPGTLVGSPIVVAGITARPPAQGRLNYRVRDASGNEIGAGSFGVSGAAGQPATFNASLVFTPPAAGGNIGVEIFERDASGATVASATVALSVASAQQTIAITSPVSGTLVGSPVFVTGRTARPPAQGRLNYRVRAAGGNQLGAGTFPVSGATFNASIGFNLPAAGGPIVLEIFEVGANSAVVAGAAVNLRVNPQPYPQPQVAP
ncbi:MAG TPA: Gmad2 immunoglobulin-like domain-containing protein [Roseiflexaceae bacterium]